MKQMGRRADLLAPARVVNVDAPRGIVLDAARAVQVRKLPCRLQILDGGGLLVCLSDSTALISAWLRRRLVHHRAFRVLSALCAALWSMLRARPLSATAAD